LDELRTRFIATATKTSSNGDWESAPGVARRGSALSSTDKRSSREIRRGVRELAARASPAQRLDWRGQGDSERTLSDPLKAHVGDFSEYDSDLRPS